MYLGRGVDMLHTPDVPGYPQIVEPVLHSEQLSTM
jgi:hypothetical protein